MISVTDHEYRGFDATFCIFYGYSESIMDGANIQKMVK